MQYQHIIVERGPISSITLNRPERRNALNHQLLQEITGALNELDKHKDVRVIILKGAGRGFCAGAELDSLIPGEDILQSRSKKTGLIDVLTAMGKVGKIIIAQVHGFALAGGFGLATAADLTILADNAVIGLPEIKRGLFPYNVMNPIGRVMPRKHILEMMFTGENITSRQALEWGLVNRVVPAEKIQEASMEIASKIARHSSAVIRLGKESYYTMQDMEYFKAFNYLTDMLTITAASQDAHEGVRAFFEKREPVWS
jgi:enoyl-CoA hydratase/carnithine racemase